MDNVEMGDKGGKLTAQIGLANVSDTYKPFFFSHETVQQYDLSSRLCVTG